ncbi:hypothetical protein DSECCO2_359240 [anaerobic digester metagenome]
MLADDDGRLVAPEHKSVAFKVFEHVFFGGQVKVRIGFVADNAKHKDGFWIAKLVFWHG